ncbi:hypothetical protein VNI00_014337 [Paramarasmius palmivorus]|uniref:Uncharacterized protein n=1 Tax=Paramarasmius palmivorus TaxID=297713 RepID=A0AAW0BSS9_9AGAR
MKFATPLIAALTFATTALAVPGKASIGSPEMWADVAAGTNVTIRVDVEPIPQNINEVGIAIGLQSCEQGKCFQTDDMLGTVVYQGKFNPVYNGSTPSLPPHENINVYIPADFPKGNAILGLANLALVGASSAPLYNTYNISVNVV